MEVTKEVKQLQEGVELISTGLLMIDQNYTSLINLGGPKMVDVTARLNAQYQALEKVIRPLKETIKVESLKARDETVRGDLYQAVVSKVVRTVLDVNKIKDYFGSQLPQFEKDKKKTEVSFYTKV